MSYSNTIDLPQQLRSLVESTLQVGERVTWMEQPIRWRRMVAVLPNVLGGVWFAAPGLYSTVLAFVLAYQIVQSGLLAGSMGELAICFVLLFFGAPFALFGLWQGLAPYLAWRIAERSVYVLTERRAILFLSDGWGKVAVRSFAPEKFNYWHCKRNIDGSGDVVFFREAVFRSGRMRQFSDIGFVAIRDVDVVKRKTRELMRSNTRHLLIRNETEHAE